MECPIQCGNESKIKFRCGHSLCVSCYCKIITTTPRCPLCRRSFILLDVLGELDRYDPIYGLIFESMVNFGREDGHERFDRINRQIFFIFIKKYLSTHNNKNYFGKLKNMSAVNKTEFMDFLSTLHRYSVFCSKGHILYIMNSIIDNLKIYGDEYVMKIGHKVTIL